MNDIKLLYVALIALAGGLVAAFAGYLDSQEDFNPRKFGRSVIASLFAAVVFALGYQFVNGFGWRDALFAFLGGAGVDVLSNRIVGAVKAVGNRLPAPPPG